MKRKFNIRKLILGLSTIGMLALTTTTSTYAWFKMNAKASVENFNFEVIGGKGFMVSIDGGTWYNDLNKEQLEKAMIVSMSSGRYEIGYETDEEGKITESDVLYRVFYKSGIRTRQKVEDPDELVENMMKNLQLSPVTSKNGCEFTNLLGVGQNASSGSFAEFGVYFKSTSSNPDDNLKYDIYLDGYGGLDNDGNKVLPTKFTSELTKVKLLTDMNAVVIDEETGNKSLPYTPGTSHSYTYSAGKYINVYSTNAARISTVVNSATYIEEGFELTKDVTFGDKYYYVKEADDNYIQVPVSIGDDVPENTYYEHIDAITEYNPILDSSLIFEINDTGIEQVADDKKISKKDFNLGSYVSTYDHTYNNGDYDMDTYYNYSYECNAMYTYYNNLRDSAPLDKNKMPYDALPKTIKSLPTVSSNNITSEQYDTIVQVASGEEEKLVTFRIWLEGWDADCFDGLSKKIDVRLALASKRVN